MKPDEYITQNLPEMVKDLKKREQRTARSTVWREQ